MKAIIAAGGSGTRLRPLTFSSNKHMLPVANKELLLYPFEAIVETGITEIGIVVNHTRPTIESLIGDGSKWGVNVTYIDQPKALGLAHVVKICKDFIDGDSFVYHLGDNIFSDGIMAPYKKFVETNPAALLTILEHEENHRLGVPYFDEDGNLEKVVEKPKNPPNKYGVPGLYFFSSKVFNAFEGEDAIQPSARGELEVTDLYTYLLQHGEKVETGEISGRWLDPGKFDDMLVSNAYLLERKTDSKVEGLVDEQSNVSGVLELGEGSTIASSAITGTVSVGENVSIEGCTIGPNVSIADGCILKNVTLSNTVVMQDSTIENLEKPLVDSIIGKQTHVWENKEEQDNVNLFIGDHCNVRLS